MVKHILGTDELQVRFLLGAPIRQPWFEWLGGGLQIRIIQVQVLSVAPPIMEKKGTLCLKLVLLRI